MATAVWQQQQLQQRCLVMRSWCCGREGWRTDRDTTFNTAQPLIGSHAWGALLLLLLGTPCGAICDYYVIKDVTSEEQHARGVCGCMRANMTQCFSTRGLSAALGVALLTRAA
jgi:hypothetical protein